MREPRYWQHETSGIVRPAVEAYLRGEPLTSMQVVTLRAYLAQWILATVWNENPHATGEDRERLADLRGRVNFLESRRAIMRWLADAEAAGFDPL